MPRYIDADALIRLIEIDALCNGGNFSKRDVIGCVKVSPTIDVVPRAELDAMRGAANSYKMHYEKAMSEVALNLISELKKEVHDKAVYPYTQEMHSYISLRVFDGIIQKYINKYREGRYEN